jgi:hypothetical protein
MKLDDVEKGMWDAKFHHLTDDELDTYRGQGLDEIGLARAEAHLKLCLICERRLALLREEGAALEDREVTAEDVAMVKRVMQQRRSQQQTDGSNPDEVATGRLLPDRLAEYLSQAAASWQAHFMRRVAVRGSTEVWNWQSDDGLLKAVATLEENTVLTIHFSSEKTEWEGARFKVRLGPVSRETTMQRVSDSRVYARVEVPLRERPKNLSDISIERI